MLHMWHMGTSYELRDTMIPGKCGTISYGKTSNIFLGTNGIVLCGTCSISGTNGTFFE